MQATRTNQDFVRLWTQHTRKIYAYLLTLVENHADADDLLQETGVILWEKFDQFEPGTSFLSWACQTAYFCVNNFRRRRNRGAMVLDDELLEVIGAELSAAPDAIGDQLDALSQCLAQLRPIDRDLIARRYRSGVSIETLSGELGRSASALYKALQRIHVLLFECIRRRLADQVGR